MVIVRKDDVLFLPCGERRAQKINFGDLGKRGIAPLGIEHILDGCGLNNPSLWSTARPILSYGLLCPKAKLKTALVEQRIDMIAHLYPMTNMNRALGVAVHERDGNLRGFHLIGDDEDIAAMWTSFFTYENSLHGWDVPRKAMCWTAMAPGAAYVPYMDLDEQGMQSDFHRVWTQRVAPTISCIQRALGGMVNQDEREIDVKPLVFFNSRCTGELWKFSFHVHWPTLGVAEIGEWKQFLLSIVEMPRKLKWTNVGGVWNVGEDPKTPIFDPAVYGGRRQLFRGPFCGKSDNGEAVLLPCAMQQTAGGEYAHVAKSYTVAQIKDYILKARIARWADGLTMLKFNLPVFPVRVPLVESEVLPSPILPTLRQDNDGSLKHLNDFVLPFFHLFILPRWQAMRKREASRLRTAGAVVPTNNIKIVHMTPHQFKPGCIFMAVAGDTFCCLDAAHVHTQSAAPIGLLVDFVRCTIEQTCYACGSQLRAGSPGAVSDKFCFLHANNRIEICTESDSAFTGISFWVPTKSPYQLLLDYFSDLFVFQRSCKTLWVYDKVFRVWRTDAGGNGVVGGLIDELNERHVKYLQCYKKIVIQKQNNSFTRMNPTATQEEVEAFSVRIHSEARKFMQKNTPFIVLNSAARGKVLDDMKSYHIHNEIAKMNCVPNYIPMKNGKYVDVFTGEVADMEASHYFTSCVNAEIIPLGEETERLERWFLEIASGEVEKGIYLKRFAGYCFTFLVHDRKFLLLKGTGKNAKGAWKEFIMKISKGPEGMDSRAKNLLQNFWDKRGNANTSPENATPESYELNNKTFLYTDDIMPIPLDTNKLKRVVAGEDGSGRGLYGKPIDIQSQGKVVWTSNFDSDGPGEDNAFWERQVIVPMLTKYVGKGEVVDEKNYRFAQNHVAYTELLELRDAFFTVVVAELVKYYKGLPWDAVKRAPSELSAFPLPESVVKYNQEARARALPLAGFMKDYTRPELYPMNFCKVEDAFESYMIYLENLNEARAKKETTLNSFTKLLAIALDVNVERGYIQGRAMHKKIISTKKKQYEDRSYSSSSSVIAPVDDLAYLGRAMNGPVV